MTKKRKPRDAHVVMGGKGMRCMRCGTEEGLPYGAGGRSVMARDGAGGFVERWQAIQGISIAVMEAYGKAFSSVHVDCEAGDPRGKARMTYSSPEEWIGSWDTGISSLVIYGTFKKKSLPQLLRGQVPFGDPVPHDPDDFGRCYRLLKVAPPEWSVGLVRVVAKHPCWIPYVEAWDELVELYEEEFESGSCPKLYERLQRLRDEAVA